MTAPVKVIIPIMMTARQVKVSATPVVPISVITDSIHPASRIIVIV